MIELGYSVAGARSVEIAAEHRDGLIGTQPIAQPIAQFREEGGEGRPTYGRPHVRWAAEEAEARRTAHRVWPNAAITGGHMLELYEREILPHFREGAR
jgi:hypothetical protein